MLRNVLPFPANTRRTGPDPAVAALPLLRALRDTVPAAAAFADTCHQLARQAERRQSPPAYFFHHAFAQPPVLSDLDRFGPAVVRERPDLAATWTDLSDRCADAVSLARASAAVRRVARAVPGLIERISELADDHAGCRKLRDALAVADDFPLTIIAPNVNCGWRFLLHGVADLHHLHGLLADTVGPGANPIDADGLTTLRYQFVRPSGLRPDGTLPTGPVGVDHWLWGHERPTELPAVQGERLLLLTDAPYPRAIPAAPDDPDIPARLELLEVLSAEQMAGWVRVLGGRPAERREAA